MKYFLIISAAIAFFNSVPVAAEVNEPVAEIESTRTSTAHFQNAENVKADKETRVISENTAESRDWIITSFTFLLAALTVMATLFGVFIGYIGYKSGKEYEREVNKAEDAAKRAEAAAKDAEAIIGHIRKKGDKTITEMKTQFEQMFKDIKSQENIVGEESLILTEKVDRVTQKIADRFVVKDFKGSADIIEGAISFAGENPYLWHLWALVLYLQNKFEDALEKINTAISKDTSSGPAYHMRVSIKLDWWFNLGGPKPSKSEVISDMMKALKYGIKPTITDKNLFAKFLDDDEYKDLFGKTKEEDEFGAE